MFLLSNFGCLTLNTYPNYMTDVSLPTFLTQFNLSKNDYSFTGTGVSVESFMSLEYDKETGNG